MAFDRFVYWTDKKPTREEVQFALEDYVRDLAVSVEWKDNRFYVLLPGMGSHPLARVSDYEMMAILSHEERENERWFEVYVDDDHVDVITRRGDWITGVIATGFAKLCEQFWGGRLEMG